MLSQNALTALWHALRLLGIFYISYHCGEVFLAPTIAHLGGKVLHIPAELLGMTLLAIGNGIPDLMTSMVACRQEPATVLLAVPGASLFLLGCVLPLVIFIFRVKIKTKESAGDAEVEGAIKRTCVRLRIQRAPLQMVASSLALALWIVIVQKGDGGGAGRLLWQSVAMLLAYAAFITWSAVSWWISNGPPVQASTDAEHDELEKPIAVAAEAGFIEGVSEWIGGIPWWGIAAHAVLAFALCRIDKDDAGAAVPPWFLAPLGLALVAAVQFELPWWSGAMAALALGLPLYLVEAKAKTRAKHWILAPLVYNLGASILTLLILTDWLLASLQELSHALTPSSAPEETRKSIQAILAVTLLSWGNSFGDFVTNAALASRNGAAGATVASGALMMAPLQASLLTLGAGFAMSSAAELLLNGRTGKAAPALAKVSRRERRLICATMAMAITMQALIGVWTMARRRRLDAALGGVLLAFYWLVCIPATVYLVLASSSNG